MPDMTQKNRFFNGTVLTINGSTTVAAVMGISYKDGGSWIDVTVPEDLVKIYQLSTQDDVALQIKYKGVTTLTRGEILTALSITWSDGSTSSISSQQWQVGEISKGGDWDAPVTGTIEIRPTVAASS